MALVDVVVVAFNSRANLRACLDPIANANDVNVILVDNASTDGSLDRVADLPLHTIPLSYNAGFAHGCNVGTRAGSAPYVLFLNPDATIEAGSIRRLVRTLDVHPAAGAVAPQIFDSSGAIHHSLRRFPRLRSTYAQAFFLHRLFPRALWADETIRRSEQYARPGTPEWVSGACILVRRPLLDLLNGLDERFFLYCEDTDLCFRIWKAGYEVRFEPEARVVHEGGASAPRSALFHIAAASKILYAQKHRKRPAAVAERIGIGLGALTHMLVASGSSGGRAGHARSLRRVASRSSR